MTGRGEVPELDSVGAGTAAEATAALGRLLAVTQAGYERRAQLEHALRSRVAIEQAKGIVAERYGMDPEDAFALIRRAARSHRVKLHDVVRRIRPREPLPPELQAVLERLSGTETPFRQPHFELQRSTHGATAGGTHRSKQRHLP